MSDRRVCVALLFVWVALLGASIALDWTVWLVAFFAWAAGERWHDLAALLGEQR